MLELSYRHSAVAFLACLAGAVLAVYSIPARAQTPTPDQIRMFQSLPEEQRDAILQQLGIGQGGANGAAGAVRQNQGTISVSQPAVRDAAGAGDVGGASEGRARTLRDRRIKGGEQVLIELELATGPRAEGGAPPVPANPQVAAPVSSRSTAQPTEPNPIEQRRLDELRTRILNRNPYQLTRFGVLQILGFEPIPLAGLSEQEVQERLAADPMLRDFVVSVKVLRLEPQGALALKPFGYEIFRSASTAFVPGTDIPVPPGYKVGPGDVMSVQLYGQQTHSYTLPVARDGDISLPEIGPISVGGLGFGAAQSLVEQRVGRQIIGTHARVTLTELRSQRVLVLGDAEMPGSYVVSSLPTVTNALFASGGVKRIGSLRNIEVRRGGTLVRNLDLYDILLKGDTANDVTLQTGDVIFVPPVGTTAGIEGEIRRPAIYELTKDKTLGQLISLAGGLDPEADASAITIERVAPSGGRTAVGLDLAAPGSAAFELRSGDIVHIAPVRPVVDNGITVEGYVYRPGVYGWREGLRVSDVLRSIDDLKPRADIHYVLVRREAPDTRRLTVQSVDLAAALAAPRSAADLPLSARDRIVVFDLVAPRDRVVDALLEEFRIQSRPDDPMAVVYIDGRVNAPGAYPLDPGMHVSDLLRAGGGLQDAAYGVSAELTSHSVVDKERRRAEIQQVDLGALVKGDTAADPILHAYDVLTIKVTPEWGRLEQIELVGEVKFPGIYQVRRGEVLSSILRRAGGLTLLAFPQGAVFTREDLKQREREQLNRLASRLESDLASLSLQASQSSPGAVQAVSAGQGLLDQLRQTKPAGRLVIDLAALVNDRTAKGPDVTLRNGDKLVVPRITEEVSVLGEVQNATSHLWRSGLTRDSVVDLSGGTTARADRKRIYIVRADGSVVGSNSSWIGSGNAPVQPGDTVVVPLDAEKMRPLPMWTAITTIVYNLAIAAAAVTRL